MRAVRDLRAVAADDDDREDDDDRARAASSPARFGYRSPAFFRYAFNPPSSRELCFKRAGKDAFQYLKASRRWCNKPARHEIAARTVEQPKRLRGPVAAGYAGGADKTKW